MLNLPIPRRSFLDSRLRNHGQETRRVAAGSRTGDSHLGLGRRVAPEAPNQIRHRSPARRAL
ncbi:MAG: hypothetical protein AAF791_15935 [Bacteroidota bacterium]